MDAHEENRRDQNFRVSIELELVATARECAGRGNCLVCSYSTHHLPQRAEDYYVHVAAHRIERLERRQ